MPRIPEQPPPIERARALYAARAWRGAFDAFVAADEIAPLSAEDLERLTWSATLIGQDDRFLASLERLHQMHKDAGEPARAARCAFWLGFRLMSLGEAARGTGWFGRCQRLVDEVGAPCVEGGYLLLPQAIRAIRGGDFAAAAALAAEAASIGAQFGDADLVALARDLEGRSLLRAGQVERGMALFDEGMVAAAGGELSPLITGLLLCSVISNCKRMFDWERAREWSSVLSAWCDAQPDLVTFRGACQVHRSQVLQLAGQWAEAMVQVERAVADGSDVDRESKGDACYQQGELFRLRGAFADANAAYDRAGRLGREPQPGLALLRLAQGKRKVAAAGIGRALAEESDPLARAPILPAAIEIALAMRDLEGARAWCQELDEIAHKFHSDVLDGIAANARGLWQLAAGDSTSALGPLRHAHFIWQRVGAPYEEARVQVAVARACDALGDTEGAARARDAARATFARLGAEPDLAALNAGDAGGSRTHGLTPRELEVLRLVATGMTNRAVAATLDLSEKTIDRHVSNIFMKINVNSRTAATAFAYEHALI